MLGVRARALVSRVPAAAGGAARWLAQEGAAAPTSTNTIAVAVPRAWHDVRADRWVRQLYPSTPLSLVMKLFRQKRIRTEGTPLDIGSRLQQGTIVTLPAELASSVRAADGAAVRDDRLAQLAREAKAAWIVYEDDDVCVLNKPAGFAVQGGSGVAEHVDALLPLMFGGREALEERGARLVHRLDRDTSGILVLAKHRQAAVALSSSFRKDAMGEEPSVRKVYWALLAGRPLPPTGRIKVPLQRVFRGGRSRTVARFDLVNDSGFVDVRREKRAASPTRTPSHVTIASEANAFDGDDAGDESDSGERGRAGVDSKPQLAITRYSLLDVAHQVASLVELTPATGRTHQLRVHCAEVLHLPIVGDFKYGQRAQFKAFSEFLGASACKHLYLHARSIVFPHPFRPGHTVEVDAALPAHFERAVKTLELDGTTAPRARHK